MQIPFKALALCLSGLALVGTACKKRSFNSNAGQVRSADTALNPTDGCVDPGSVLFQCKIAGKDFRLSAGKGRTMCLNGSVGLAVVGGGGDSSTDLTLCPKGTVAPYDEAADECDTPILIERKSDGFYVFERGLLGMPTDVKSVKCEGGLGYVSNGGAILTALGSRQNPPAYKAATSPASATTVSAGCASTDPEFFSCTFSGGEVRLKPAGPRQVCVNGTHHLNVYGGYVGNEEASFCLFSANGKDSGPYPGVAGECEAAIVLRKTAGKWSAQEPGKPESTCTGGSLWSTGGQATAQQIVEPKNP